MFDSRALGKIFGRKRGELLVVLVVLAVFLISNFRLVLNVLCFLLGNSPASKFYMLTFSRNILFQLHRQGGMKKFLRAYLLTKLEQCSETSEYKVQTPWNYPEESTQQELGEWTKLGKQLKHSSGKLHDLKSSNNFLMIKSRKAR